MKNSNKNELLTKKNKILSGVVIGLLTLVLLGGATLGVGFGVYGKNTEEWFKPVEEEIKAPEADGGGMVVSPSASATIELKMSAAVAQADGSTTQTITATMADNVINKNVDWSVAFKNASSTWANGKNVTNYLTITPASDGALTATITCKAAFGEQIIITCSSRDGAATATATADYIKRITNADIKINGTLVSTGNAVFNLSSDDVTNNNTVELVYTWTDGTITPQVKPVVYGTLFGDDVAYDAGESYEYGSVEVDFIDGIITLRDFKYGTMTNEEYLCLERYFGGNTSREGMQSSSIELQTVFNGTTIQSADYSIGYFNLCGKNFNVKAYDLSLSNGNLYF